jgi:sensor histidine kinase YesM
MADIELTIKTRDWVYILIIGVIFGTLLSVLGYKMLQLPLEHGALFGAELGFSITLFSLLFISWMNQSLLPRIDKGFWIPIAVLFSFLSGFLGTYVAVWLSQIKALQLPSLFDESVFTTAILIGVLTYVVGSLLYRFVLMRNQKEEVDTHYTQSRLKSLETQLNPHFLFNALNSVAELIHDNPAKAEDAVLKISSFLRNTMQEQAMVSLQTEFRNVTDYVELENIRFSGAVRVTLPKVTRSDIMLPKFSVQLLVENAIKHGFTPDMPSLNILIDIDEDAGYLLVMNDGLPMTDDHFGIGLTNLDERLKHLCKGRLEVQSKKPPTFLIHYGGNHS